MNSLYDIDSIVINDEYTVDILPFKLTWAKCAICKDRIITSETCVMMSCKCVYCYNCMFQKTRCTIHRRISIANYKDNRINTICKYDLLIYTSTDVSIETLAKQLYERGDAQRLLKNIDRSMNIVDYALFFEEEETYDLAIVLVAKAAIKYYVFRLYLPIEVSDKIHEINIQYMYKLLKKTHIYIAIS